MNPTNNMNYTWEIMKVFFYLGVVILLIYLLTHFLRKFKNYSRQQGSLIQIVERNFLTQDAQVVIIEVSDKYYLLGVTGEKVTLLDTFTELDSIKEKNLIPHSNPNFIEIFKRTYKKKDGGDE